MRGGETGFRVRGVRGCADAKQLTAGTVEHGDMTAMPELQGGTVERLPQRHNIFALGDGMPDVAPEHCLAACDPIGPDDLDAPRDLRNIVDAVQRAGHEDNCRHAAMCRRRQEQAAAAEAAGGPDSAVELEPPTASLAARQAARKARALSYCAGDGRKLDAYVRHHQAEEQGNAAPIKYAGMRAALCAALLDGTDEEIELAKAKLSRARSPSCLPSSLSSRCLAASLPPSLPSRSDRVACSDATRHARRL